MNYEEMSDFEINAAVAKIRHEKKVGYFDDGDWCKDPDYCNNASDAFPIITEHGISIVFLPASGCWAASDSRDSGAIYHLQDSPLKAAMICFLKMKDTDL